MGNVACCASAPSTKQSDKAAVEAFDCRAVKDKDTCPQEDDSAPLKLSQDPVKVAVVNASVDKRVADEPAAADAPVVVEIPATVAAEAVALIPAPAPAAICDVAISCCPPVAANEPPQTEMILNLLHPEDGPAAGLPYQAHFLGPPQPPCEDTRLATIRALHTLEAPPDPEIGSILKTVASIFKSPATLVAKFEDKRVYISDSEGALPRGDFPWRWTLCAWSMAYKNPQVLVIPDTLQDARFRHNEKVTTGPRVRFYCGAPLVASNGHRLGTICFLDVKPREFDAASAFILNNFAELVVRRLEKDIAMKMTEKKNNELAEAYGGLQRAIDTVDTCVVMVDTEAPGWQIVYTNAAFNNITDINHDAMKEKPLNEVFEGPKEGVSLPLESHVTDAAKCHSFAVDNIRFKDSKNTTAYTLHWRPACRAIDDAMMPVGVPSFLRPHGNPGEDGSVSPSRYYFVTMEPGKEGHCSVNSLNSMTSGSTVVEGLELAHLLGKGAFGSVYAGTWWNAPVAVKIIEQELKPLLPGVASLEAVLGAELRHPNIVSTLHYTTRKVPFGSVTDSAKEVTSNNGKGGVMSSITPASCMSSDTDASVKKLWAVITSVPVRVEEVTDSAHGTENMLSAAAVVAPIIGASDVGPTSGEHVEAGLAVARSSETDSTGVPDATSATGWSYTAGQNVQKKGEVAPVLSGFTDTSANSAATQTMIILEYCDKGCLQEAIDRGWLRTTRSDLHGGVNLEAVLSTAREIGAAMAFLHSHRILHGDLSAWNVMLSSSNSSLGTRGFVAKVADFGLARSMHDTSRILTNTYGTLTHMPPETLTEGVISFAMDVYSYGVLLWQMYTGSRPWSGLRFPQIVMLVGQQHKQLQFLPGSHPGFVKLASDCMAIDPKARPTFEQVLERLQELQESLLNDAPPEN